MKEDKTFEDWFPDINLDTVSLPLQSHIERALRRASEETGYDLSFRKGASIDDMPDLKSIVFHLYRIYGYSIGVCWEKNTRDFSSSFGRFNEKHEISQCWLDIGTSVKVFDDIRANNKVIFIISSEENVFSYRNSTNNIMFKIRQID